VTAFIKKPRKKPIESEAAEKRSRLLHIGHRVELNLPTLFVLGLICIVVARAAVALTGILVLERVLTLVLLVVPTAVILYAAQAHRMLQPWCRDCRNGGGGGGGGTPPVPGPGPDGLRLTPVGE